ncbi:hypothetical protein EI555_001800, partial [Monodon monoceros]
CLRSRAALESSAWGRLGTCLPSFHNRRGGLPAPASAPTTTTTPINGDIQGKEGAKLCQATGQREAGAPRPSRKSLLGRPDPTHRKSPAEPGSGAQLAALCARRGTAPGPLAPSEPSPQRARRAMGAGGRRATGCAAAASGGATASRAGAGGWGVGERGGGGDAAGAEAQLQGGGNRNVTSAPGGEDGEGETGTPSRRRTPTSGPPRFLFLLLSRDSRLSAFPSTRAPTPRTPTLPGLFGFNLL